MAKQYPEVPNKSADDLKKLEAAIEKGLGHGLSAAEALKGCAPVLPYDNGSKMPSGTPTEAKSYIGNSKGDKKSPLKDLEIKGKPKKTNH